MPEDLYDRYQVSRTVYRQHRTTCTDCTDTSRCSTGARLWESFCRLQDAYLNRQRQQRR
ncbi:hypothetical protein [Streptomyces sp. NPDC021608]|uniref:hypothetical protein n=1 Tax=Streptomyces sp. NPDC021608 TaxID=3154903 RepID=UPI0033C9E7BC